MVWILSSTIWRCIACDHWVLAAAAVILSEDGVSGAGPELKGVVKGQMR